LEVTIIMVVNKIENTGEDIKMKEEIEAILDQIRPNLKRDGGNVELVDAEDGIVKVRLTGACGSCPMATMTLKQGVERVLKEKLPEIKQVVAV
jgi:Fe-S cluster biogenesis protein NfuA